MEMSSLVAQLFNQTAVNTESLESYLNALPVYYQTSLNGGADKQTLQQLSHVDSFEFAFRQYLVGKSSTLQPVYQEIQRFQRVFKISAWHLIAYTLESVQLALLHYEAYELMPRYDQALTQIEGRFTIDLGGCLKVTNMMLDQARKRL